MINATAHMHDHLELWLKRKFLAEKGSRERVLHPEYVFSSIESCEYFVSSTIELFDVQ